MTNSIELIKNYRIVKLTNGITALIISDPSPIIENKRDEIHENNSSTSCVATDENEIDEDEEDDDDDDEDGSDSDEEESSNRGPKEKLAACSLCIDVGYVNLAQR